MILNIKLKKARKKAGLTQAQIAQKVNISVRHYQSIEAGTSKSSVDIAKLIAQVLNSTVEDLF